MEMQIPFQITDSFPLGVYSEERLLDHMIILFFSY